MATAKSIDWVIYDKNDFRKKIMLPILIISFSIIILVALIYLAIIYLIIESDFKNSITFYFGSFLLIIFILKLYYDITSSKEDLSYYILHILIFPKKTKILIQSLEEMLKGNDINYNKMKTYRFMHLYSIIYHLNGKGILIKIKKPDLWRSATDSIRIGPLLHENAKEIDNIKARIERLLIELNMS